MALTKVQTIGIETGITFTGITTTSSLQATTINVSGIATFGGNVSIAGTLTYEDVTDVDSVGLITARSGVSITGGGLVVTGVTTVSAGSTSIPSISPSGDTNTGIFFPSADTIAFGEGGAEAARIDSNSKLLVGMSTSVVAGDSQYAKLQVRSNTYGTNGNGILSLQAGTTTPASGNALGTVLFADNTGGEYGRIDCYVDATPGTNDYPGRLVFSTTADGASSPTERARITSAGYFGIGNTNPGTLLTVGGSSADGSIFLRSGSNNVVQLYSVSPGGAYSEIDSQTEMLLRTEAGAMRFSTVNTERARIDSSGRLLVGTSSSRVVGGTVGSRMQVEYAGGSGFNGLSVSATDGGATVFINNASSTTIASGALVGRLGFTGYDGTDTQNQFASIEAYADATVSNDDVPGRLVFSTTADGASSPTERFRINKDGTLYSANNSVHLGTEGAVMSGGGRFTVHGDFFNSTAGAAFSTTNDTNGAIYIQFGNSSGTKIGSITRASSTSVAYNTTSDYRLKENVLPIQAATQLISQLKPVSYNFIGHADEQSTGFIAHELQEIIPEAVTGDKDATYADGSPNYQGVDLSKLVPLLTAALQEALAEIESLKSRLTALEP